MTEVSRAEFERECRLQAMIISSARNTRDLLARASQARRIAEAYHAAAKISAASDVELQSLYIAAYCEEGPHVLAQAPSS